MTKQGIVRINMDEVEKLSDKLAELFAEESVEPPLAINAMWHLTNILVASLSDAIETIELSNKLDVERMIREALEGDDES